MKESAMSSASSQRVRRDPPAAPPVSANCAAARAKMKKRTHLIFWPKRQQYHGLREKNTRTLPAHLAAQARLYRPALKSVENTGRRSLSLLLLACALFISRPLVS